MTGARGVALAALVAIGAGVVGCGAVTDPRVAARDRATTASCDYYQRCNLIGPGQETMGGFADRSSCEVNARAFWENAWPVNQCSGKIDQAGLSICINAINATLCMSGADVLATLYIKCPASMVCTAAVDAGDQN